MAALEGHLEALTARIQALEAQNSALVASSSQERNLVKLNAYNGNESDVWQVFEQQTKEVARINRWSDETTRRTVKASLKGTAATRAHHINPDSYGILDDMLKALRELFVPRSSMELARVDLDIISQKPGEDVAIYHSRVRFVAIQAYGGDVENSDQAIRSFIKGLASTTVKDHVLLQTSKTFSKALSLAQEKLGVERLIQHFSFGAAIPETPGSDMKAANPDSTPMEIGAMGEEIVAGMGDAGGKPASERPKFPPCCVCMKTNHPVERCFLLKRMKKAYEIQQKLTESKDGDESNKSKN